MNRLRLSCLFVGAALLLFFLISNVDALQISGGVTATTPNCSTIFCDLTDDLVYWENLQNIPALDTNTVTASWTNSGGDYLMDLNMNGNSIIGAFDVNASNNFNVGNRINTAYLCDNFGVGCWDLTGDPYFLGGMDLRLGQDLWLDGNIFPFTTLVSNLGSGANRWLNLFVAHVNTEDLVATGDVNAGTFFGDGSHLTGISTLDTNLQSAGHFNPDTNTINITKIVYDLNNSWGTVYCTDGNIVTGFIEGYSC